MRQPSSRLLLLALAMGLSVSAWSKDEAGMIIASHGSLEF